MTTNSDPSLGPRYRRAGRTYPELARFADDGRRKDAMTSATHEVMRSRRFWLFMIGALLVALAVGVSVRLLVTRSSPALFGGIQGMIAGMLAGGWVIVCRSNLRASLRRQLVEQGVPICLRCGYDLRGQLEPCCSECGSTCDPSLLPLLKSESTDAARAERVRTV